MSNLKRPHYFTPKEDRTIVELFPIVSTEKLSIMMNLHQDKIISRYRHLTNNIHRYPYLRAK